MSEPSLKQRAEGTIVTRVLTNLQNSHLPSTFLGLVLAGLVAAKVDYGKVINGDTNEIANLISAVIVAVLGYFIKGKPNGKSSN